ncbi:MAG TPA: ATP-binding protein, partial [Chromatiales bacterium]|nr:ATP-binding protein [Chromatiales bacterium]
RERVLQRFYRLDESRSAPGAGLGLSLVKAIAQRHKAELRLEDNNPGLRVVLKFPASDSPES